MDILESKRKRRTRRDYTMGFKSQIVAAVEKGDMTYKQAQKIYGIQGRSTVLTWLRKLGCRAWRRPKKKAYCQGARRLQKQKGLSLSRACELLGITQQAVYQREKRIEQRAIELVPVKTMVMDARRFMPRLGARKLYFLLKPRFEEQGIKLGRDDFIDYLRDHQLLVKPVKRYTKTTHSKHWMKKYPNRFESLNHLC